MVHHIKIDRSDMLMGTGLFNYRCHQTSVQYAIDNPKAKVYMCLTIDGNQPFLHFINKIGNKYIDNTLGYEYTDYEYRIIRKINKNEYHDIVDIFVKTRNHLFNINTNWLEKLLTNSTII